MYQISTPVFVHALQNLSAILGKAALDAETRKIEPSVLIEARLAPDMFPLARQVQIATDVVKGGIARLAGQEAPSFPDDEKTFPELQARLEKTIAFLQSVPAAKIDGSEERDIALKVGGRDLHFKGKAYLLQFVTPNLYFHCAVAYAILRHNGVDIGKMDFLGPIQ